MSNMDKTHNMWDSGKSGSESGFEGFLWVIALGLIFSGVGIFLLPLLYFAPRVPTAKYDRSLGNAPIDHSPSGYTD